MDKAVEALFIAKADLRIIKRIPLSTCYLSFRWSLQGVVRTLVLAGQSVPRYTSKQFT